MNYNKYGKIKRRLGHIVSSVTSLKLVDKGEYMYFAIDDNKIRVYADEAEKDENYYCPVCGNKVVLKRGDINAAHFAHEKNECADRWNYDMSEWHIRMQELFPVENREVIVTYKGVKHRADILKNGIVIEFQHSPISAEEFCERNDFYRNAGYKIAWVFDVSQQYYDGSLYYDEESDKELYIWKNPKRLFQFAPNPSDYDKNFSVWLYWGNDYDDDYEEFFNKVIWSSKDDYDNPSYKRIILSNIGIEVNKDIKVEEFFILNKIMPMKQLGEQRKIGDILLGTRE